MKKLGKILFFSFSLLMFSSALCATTYEYVYGTGFKEVPKGYHEQDDKSDFWIPKNINPLMMTNQQLETYRIIKNTTKCSKNPFCEHQIENAKKRKQAANYARYKKS